MCLVYAHTDIAVNIDEVVTDFARM